MEIVRDINERKPVLFAFLILVAWMILVSIIGILIGSLLRRPMADPLIQSLGTLAATLLLLFGAHRLGWINKIGITNFGSLTAWIVTIALTIYVLLVGFFAYFGEFYFKVGSILDQAAWPILLQGIRAGFVEEVVFRGIILYSLVRVLGKTNRGIVTAIIIQAFLFALPHVLQVLAGVALGSALSNVLATFIFGLWMGLLVVTVGSFWPAIFIHAVSNSFTLIKGLSTAWITPNFLGYLRGSLVELPLVLIGLWVVVKLRENQIGTPQGLSEPSAGA